MKVYFILLATLLLQACHTLPSGACGMPNPSFVYGSKLSRSDILYQYYEKYGFTDVCIHTRTYYSVKDFKPDSTWHSLPMRMADMDTINAMPNKVDKLDGKPFSALYMHKDAFADILLDSCAYVKPAKFAKTVWLDTGYYRIGNGTFEIYNTDGRIYIEHHGCDE